MFHAIHTIKAHSGLCGFRRLEAITHEGEALLEKLREDELVRSPSVLAGIHNMALAVKKHAESIRDNNLEGNFDETALVHILRRIIDGSEISAEEQQQLLLEKEIPTLGKYLLEEGLIDAGQLDAAVRQQCHGDSRHLGEILIEQEAVDSQTIRDALEKQREIKSRTESLRDTSIRVDVVELDRMMLEIKNLKSILRPLLEVAEQMGEHNKVHKIRERLDKLNSKASQLRLQSIGEVWGYFPSAGSGFIAFAQ